MTKVISYIRVSTSFQDLENQKLEISKYTAKLGLEVTEWIAVEMSSRKTTDDRRINELLDSLHKGDVLVVSELSRLARSMREIHNITHTLEQKGVCLHVVKQGIVVDGNKDIATKILINTFGVCAELERELISQRVKMGMALAKQRGRQIGNPNIGAYNNHQRDEAKNRAEKYRSIFTVFMESGKTTRQIAEELNTAQVRTPKGGRWSHTQVHRVMVRLGINKPRWNTVGQ